MTAKLLIGYDGSQDAREATEQAGRLFNGQHAVVANVWQSLAAVMLRTSINAIPATMRDFSDELDAAEKKASREIAEEGCGVARDAGLDATPRSVEGEASAWHALFDLADELDALVVVLGSRGLSGVKSMLLGSVSSGGLHHATRPLLVVPPPDRRDQDADGPILIGFDGSDHAQRAVEVAAKLLPGRKAQVITVWTSPRHAASAAVLGAPAGVIASGLEKLEGEIGEEAASIAARGAELANEGGMSASSTGIEARGNVWATLTRVAREQGAAAIVLGSHGRSGVAEALLGSVSRGATQHSPVPVLVVPPARRAD